jgi:RecA-family ATPase
MKTNTSEFMNIEDYEGETITFEKEQLVTMMDNFNKKLSKNHKKTVILSTAAGMVMGGSLAYLALNYFGNKE